MLLIIVSMNGSGITIREAVKASTVLGVVWCCLNGASRRSATRKEHCWENAIGKLCVLHGPARLCSTKNTWPDLQVSTSLPACIDTCGKAKKLFALQPLFARIDESACSRHRCCPLHTSPRSVHEPRGWRGRRGDSNLEGNLLGESNTLFKQISNGLQWPPMMSRLIREFVATLSSCSSHDVPSNRIGEDRPDVARG
jgi:hypothetical protein